MNISQNKLIGPVKCQQCSREFKNQWALEVHVRRSHKATDALVPTVKEKSKRKYNRKKSILELDTVKSQLQDQNRVCYCPRCGYAIEALQQAMIIINRMIKGDQ